MRSRQLAIGFGLAAVAAFVVAYERFEATSIQGAVFSREVGASADDTPPWNLWFADPQLWTWITVGLVVMALVAAIAYARRP